MKIVSYNKSIQGKWCQIYFYRTDERELSDWDLKYLQALYTEQIRSFKDIQVIIENVDYCYFNNESIHRNLYFIIDRIKAAKEYSSELGYELQSERISLLCQRKVIR